MSAKIIPGPKTFTYERLVKLCRERHDFRPSYRQPASSKHSLEYNRNFCLRLYAVIQDPQSHLSRLDEEFPPFRLNLFQVQASDEEVRRCPCNHHASNNYFQDTHVLMLTVVVSLDNQVRLSCVVPAPCDTTKLV